MDEYDISSCYPMDTSAGHMPFWVYTESEIQQSSTTLSGSLSLKMGNASPCGHNMKQMDFLFQDRDSSSTQSSGQSFNDVGSVGKGNSCGPYSTSTGRDCDQTLKHEVRQLESISSIGNQECVIPSQVNFGKPYACVPIPYTDPYHGGLLAQTMNLLSVLLFKPQYRWHLTIRGFVYIPLMYQHIQHSQMLGIGPDRVPLPLDLLQNEPIYVNAKQYHAILRRRQYRAKLEAQNKLSKGRKPYLHESRHLHALKRARGTGGRFINTKSPQDSKTAVTTKDNFIATQVRAVANIPKSENFHSKVFDNGFLATSNSDITNSSNSDDIYQHQEFRFSHYPLSIGSFGAENRYYLAVNQ